MTEETEVTEDPASEPEDGKTSNGEMEDPERGFVPNPEEAEDRWFRGLVRRLGDEDAEAEYEGNEEVVEDAEDRLVEQF